MNIIAFIFLSFVCARVYSERDHPRNHAYWKSFENLEKRLCKEGSRQSPINIEKDKVIKAKFKPFHFENYDAEVNASMSNNGHSIVLEIKQSTKHTSLPRISYGGLGGTYEIQELHFHWGINYNEGSEHRISGTSFPIELHMVHKKVGDKFDKNSMDLNEFAILSMMFQISTSQNSKLEPIIEGIHELREKEINRTLIKLQMNKILPRNVTEFFRYEGSFTVPSCNETVIWTVFKEPLNISKYQLYLFKQFKYPNSTTRIMNNYREVQPLNGRIVFDVTTDKLI